MDILQFIIISVFLTAFVTTIIAQMHYPEKVRKFIPYNYVVLGSLLFYLSQTGENINKFALLIGIGFFVYGILLLFKGIKLTRKN